MSQVINAAGMHYRELNHQVRASAAHHSHITLQNICGHRYIGVNMGQERATITVHGTPGNDLGAFMNGSEIIVRGNAQDGVGNTMNSGRIVVHGNAGDVAGMSMRGGKLFIQGNVGYRCALHMKEYKNQSPAIVIGGTCQDFCGEYMAGGTVVLLGLHLPSPGLHTGNFMGTGMHGGVIYARGAVDLARLGKEVGTAPLNDQDWQRLNALLGEFSMLFQTPLSDMLNRPFVKLYAKNKRPYGSLYAY